MKLCIIATIIGLNIALACGIFGAMSQKVQSYQNAQKAQIAAIDGTGIYP